MFIYRERKVIENILIFNDNRNIITNNNFINENCFKGNSMKSLLPCLTASTRDRNRLHALIK